MVFQPKYEWRNVKFPVKADVAASELTRIQEKYGEVTPKLLLDESRNKNAVLHKCYEWNDKKAAEGYRLWQSKLIMSCLTVKYEEVDEATATVKEISVRAFQNVSEERNGKFIHVKEAMETEEYRKAILRRALNELSLFRRKYSDLSELSKLFTVVDDTIETAM